MRCPTIITFFVYRKNIVSNHFCYNNCRFGLLKIYFLNYYYVGGFFLITQEPKASEIYTTVHNYNYNSHQVLKEPNSLQYKEFFFSKRMLTYLLL